MQISRMGSYQTALQTETFIARTDDEAVETPVHVQSTDKQLVDRVLAGDGFAFELIFDRHKRLVASVAGRYFRRPEEVDEIIQISFAKAYAELGSFEGRYDRSFASWLVRITSNACYDTLRNQRRKPERLDCDLSDAEADSLLELSADTSMAAERSVLDRDLTEKLLARLPDSERALLQMLYSDDMSVADIADVLGCTRANVKVRAWRARNTLRKVLRKLL